MVGWDDPRLFTISGLRRRGIPLAALNDFLDSIPVARRGNDNYIQMSKFEHVLKTYLDKNCSRMMAVSDPVLVTIENLKEPMTLQAPHFPVDSTKGHYSMRLSRRVFVDRFDVKTKSSTDHKVLGISEGQVFRLKYGPLLKVTHILTDANSKPVEIKVQLVDETSNESQTKTKVVVNWVGEEDSVNCTLRLYDQLFVVEKPSQPADDPEARRAELNPQSLVECTKAVVCRSVLDHIREKDRFQFERLGFFALDHQDSSIDLKKLVFNRIVKSQPSKPRES